MESLIPLTIGATVGAWAMLRVIGAEHERLVRERQANASAADPPSSVAVVAQSPANQVKR